MSDPREGGYSDESNRPGEMPESDPSTVTYASPPAYGPPPVYGPPVPEPNRGLSWKQALVEIVIVFAALLAPSTLLRIGYGMHAQDLAEKGLWLYGYVIIQGCLAVTAIVILLAWNRQSFRSVGLYVKNLPGDILASIVTLGIIYGLQLLIVMVVFFFFPRLAEDMVRQRREVARLFPKISVGSIALFAIFVGFYEELLFRGFLITRIKCVVRNIWLAVVLSSIFFGLIHSYQDSVAMFQISLIALIMGTLFVLRGNLVSPIVVHTAFDFFNLTLAMYWPKIMKYLEQMGYLKGTHL
jgi:membrane protease YdiL (CAAX protease family)